MDLIAINCRRGRKPMVTVYDMKKFCAQFPDDTRFVMHSLEEPEVGKVDIAFLFDTHTIEVTEDMESEPLEKPVNIDVCPGDPATGAVEPFQAHDWTPEGVCTICKQPYPHRNIQFAQRLERLINAHSQENGSNTPDFILAQYLLACLRAFNTA